MTSIDDTTLTVYGAPWCPHCKRVKKFLSAHRIPYRNVDIERDETLDQVRDRDLEEFPDIVGGHDMTAPPAREPLVTAGSDGEPEEVVE